MRAKPNATPDDIAFGINACALALSSGYAKSVLYLRDTRNERVLQLVDLAIDAGLRAEAVEEFRLDQLTGEGVHQGILVRIGNVEPVDLRQAAA